MLLPTTTTYLAATTNEAVAAFIGFWILIGMFMAIMLPILAIPFIFVKLGSVAGKVQGSFNKMGRRGVRMGAKRGKQAYKDSGFGLARQDRKDARKSERQKRTREGKGFGGRLYKGEGALSSMVPRTAGQKAGDIALTESLQSRQQKLEDAKTATLKQAAIKDAGLNYTGLVGQMHAGESGSTFRDRYRDSTGRDIGAEKAAGLEQLRSKFGNQIGTTEFSRAALLAGHDLGANAEDLNNASKAYANQMHADGKNDLEIGNEMAGVMAQSAKAGGVYSMSGTGWVPTGATRPDGTPEHRYDRFGAKDADRIIAGADFNKADSLQFGDLSKYDPTTKKGGTARDSTGNLDVGKLMADPQHALAASVVDQLSSPDQAVRTAMLKRVAEARGSKSFSDLAALVEATGQSSELTNMIAGFK